MNKYLALLAALGAAMFHAQAAPSGQRASELRQVTARKSAAGSFTPRTLSAAERAELRRQLSQYSRLPAGGKGS